MLLQKLIVPLSNNKQYMNIGNALRDFRKAKNIKQYVAAGGVGITQTYLSQIEAGKKDPSTEVIKKMGDFYQVPIVFVLFKAIDETDVQPEKRELFLQIKPLINSLIEQMF